jgi:O-antigen/teichoic acid export membrane protein
MHFAKLKSLFGDKVIRNVSWLGASELANRVFRFGTTFVLARNLEPNEYGLMAILYVFLEFSQVFIWNGVTAKIIHADEKKLNSICDTAYWINWSVCVAAFLIQCTLAYPVSKLYSSSQLFLPLCLSATTYLIVPFFLVKSSLLERAGRMKEIAFINAAQSITSNIMIIVLVVSGLGIWSIAISMVLSTLVWISVNFRESSWVPPKQVTFEQWSDIADYSKNIIGVQLLNKLRGNLDYLIIGKFLSVDRLGLYYFAFNAGSGITMNVVSTFIWALFPHLCSIRHEPNKLRKEYFKNLKVIIAVVTCVVIAQSSLSFLYVPFIMGRRWIPAIPILILVCFSVIPSSLKLISSILLNVDDKTHLTLYFDVIFTVIFAASLLTAVTFAEPKTAVYWVALAVLICNTLMGGLFAVWSVRKVFGQTKAA